MRLLRSMRVSVRLPAVIAAGVAGLIALAVVAVTTVSAVKIGGERYDEIEHRRELRADIAVPGATLAAIDQQVQRSQVELLLGTFTADQETSDRITAASEAYVSRSQGWIEGLATDAPARDAMVAAHDAAIEYLALLQQSSDRGRSGADPRAVIAEFRPAMEAALASHEEALERARIAADQEADAVIASATATADGRQSLMTWIAIIVLLTVVPLVIIVTRSITRPLASLLERLCELAHGTGDDATARLDVSGHDEFADVASAFNAFADRLDAEHDEQRAHTAEAAARALDVERSARVAAGNIRQVAAASADLSAAAGEIARNAAQASQIADGAVGTAEHANALMSRLAESSDRIGDVVESIRTIAAQTTMLALNATIEAARAGESGRGFAVVANEVKELATETGAATAEIVERVETIKRDTEAALAALAETTAIIEQINLSQATIAAAVEQQASTTAEMDQSLGEAVDAVAHLGHDELDRHHALAG